MDKRSSKIPKTSKVKMSFKQDRTIPGILYAEITDPLGKKEKRKILGIERLVKINFRKQDSFSDAKLE